MPRKRIIRIGIMFAGTLLLIATTVKSQSPARSTPVWEYSSVSGMPVTNQARSTGINSLTYTGFARICCATSQGCRTEDVTTTGPGNNEGSVAMMVAAAKLGEQGWELTTSTEILQVSVNERTLYFRRLKSDSK